jgi:hypothetical protein
MKTRVVIRWSPVRLEDVHESVWSVFNHVTCRVTGHRTGVALTTGKLALKCERCGWTSPGWVIDRNCTA